MNAKARLMSELTGSMISFGILCGLLSLPCNAEPVEFTTGDLGNNVIDDAGDFVIHPNLSAPSLVSPAEIEVKYGHWNSPDVLIDVLVNANLVGSFTANTSNAYIVPGPAYATFDITGLLVDGLNEVKFTGNYANVGDYVIGQAWIRYDTVPEPGTLSTYFALALTLTIGGAWRQSAWRR